VKHLDQEVKKNTPELKKVRFTMEQYVLSVSCFYQQAQNNHGTLLGQISELAATVNEAEDGVFEAFCRKIKVSNIREYEERQMKVAQEESRARLQYETQISRLTHQLVSEFDVVHLVC
jgi:structural maintenance of chromosome 1